MAEPRSDCPSNVLFTPCFWYAFGLGVMTGAGFAGGKPGYVTWIVAGAGLCCTLIGLAIARQIRKADAHQGQQDPEKHRDGSAP